MSVLRRVAAASVLTMLLSTPTPLWAQSSDAKASDKSRPQSGEPSKDSAGRKAEELAEIAKTLKGPEGNPECVWLGRRVVNLLWRDDLDTAFRHLDLYDRFGCPGVHIQATFRCVVRQGNIDPKVPETLSARVQACWINPATQPTPPTSAATPAAPSGTSTQ